MMKQIKQKRERILNKLREVQRLVKVIHGLSRDDPERPLVVMRWMIEAEEVTLLATEMKGLLSAQELADVEAATSAISVEETQQWKRERIQIEIMRLWTENEQR